MNVGKYLLGENWIYDGTFAWKWRRNENYIETIIICKIDRLKDKRNSAINWKWGVENSLVIESRCG